MASDLVNEAKVICLLSCHQKHSEQPIKYFCTAFLLKGRHFLITVLVSKKLCQNVCNRLVWIMVLESRMIPVIAFALLTHQMPTLKSCSEMWINMELFESLQILWDEASCASSLNRMSLTSISVPCTPPRYQLVGFSHLTIIMEFFCVSYNVCIKARSWWCSFW